MKNTLLLLAGLLPGLAATAQAVGSTSTVTGTDGITYHIVLAKDTNWWLQQSLGATRVPDSLADVSTQPGYYQWGRWNDGHELLSSPLGPVPPSPNNPAGLPDTGAVKFYDNQWWTNGTWHDAWSAATPADADTFTGCDPCKVILGTDWHLPGYDDWHLVTFKENIYNGATAYSSNLKLSYGGKRNGDPGYTGAMEGVTTDGYYWQRDPRPSDGSPFSAREVHIRYNDADIGSTLHRTQGLQVRCVKSHQTGTGLMDGKEDNTNCLFYPNPVSSTITIKASLAIESIIVTDLQGVLLEQVPCENGSTSVILSMSHLAAGMYFIQVRSGDMLVVKRICKL